MVKPPLFDSNILLDYLNGDEQARHEFDRFTVLAISQITWMEVMVGAERHPESRTQVENLLRQFTVIPIDKSIAALAAKRRALTGKKLPDCIIHATALLYASELVTRNLRDFPKLTGDDIIARAPYPYPASALTRPDSGT